MIDLGKGISQYEDEQTRIAVFEEPIRYKKIFEEDYFIISGRKGAGKSAIVDYQEALSHGKKEHIIIYRPQSSDELFETIKQIKIRDQKSYSEGRQSIAKLIEFIIYAKLMRHHIDGKENKYLIGDLGLVYNYLTSNHLSEGSVIRRSLSFISEATSDFKHLNKLFTTLGKINGPKFVQAKSAIHAYLTKKKITTRMFIDEIDGFGFEFNIETRAFLEALVICCMNVNSACIERKIPFRVYITPPTEVFDHSIFWNRDKILRKTIFIRWSNIEKLQNLVNKRISCELKIKKRQHRYTGDIFSIDTARTWNAIFPPSIENRIGAREPTLEYIARHTFYSPRSVLAICTDILNALEEKGYSLDTLSSVTGDEWSHTVQDSCENISTDLSRTVLGIFLQMYSNVEEVLRIFEKRPNIWPAKRFHSLLRTADLPPIIKSTAGSRRMDIDGIIHLFYIMGFIGYGFRKKSAPLGSRHYDVSFSYLGWTYKRKCDLLIVSPVFYDYFNINPVGRLIVRPHAALKVNYGQFQQIATYDYEAAQ